MKTTLIPAPPGSGKNIASTSRSPAHENHGSTNEPKTPFACNKLEPVPEPASGSPIRTRFTSDFPVPYVR
jgi:hypothetical protein